MVFHPKAVIAAVALGLVPAGATLAQAETRSWTLCQPTHINVCTGIDIFTAAILASDGSRSGTSVDVLLRNLDGQGLAAPGWLETAMFFFGPSAHGTSTFFRSVLAEPVGGAYSVGANSLSWGWRTYDRSSFYVGSGQVLSISGTNGTANRIGGCTDPGVPSEGIFTCGSNSAARFRFLADQWFADASTIDAVLIGGNYYSNMAMPIGNWGCYENPNAVGANSTQYSTEQCSHDPSAPPAPFVTPEPSTFLLGATGMLMVVAVRGRFKRRQRLS